MFVFLIIRAPLSHDVNFSVGPVIGNDDDDDDDDDDFDENWLLR
jgi:hypothetical protein